MDTTDPVRKPHPFDTARYGAFFIISTTAQNGFGRKNLWNLFCRQERTAYSSLWGRTPVWINRCAGETVSVILLPVRIMNSGRYPLAGIRTVPMAAAFFYGTGMGCPGL